MAYTGNDFAADTFTLRPGDPRRKAMIDAAVARGDYTHWPLIPVPIGNGDSLLASSDYFSIGPFGGDFLRVPLNAHEAQSVADSLGMLLPTTKVVDLVWQNASQRLAPIPLAHKGGAEMLSTEFAVKHNRAIENAGAKPGGLLAGTKKDVVISNQLVDFKPGAVAFYGWHRPSGEPIQQNAQAPDKASTAHEASYADYSHGVRLIHPVTLRGKRVADLYASGALNYGGPLRIFRYGGPAKAPSAPLPPGDVPTPAPSPKAPEKGPSAPASVGSDAWARRVLVAAWDNAFPPRELTLAAAQAIQAIARGESGYGRAAGSNNWGMIRCGHQPPCKPGCVEIGPPGQVGHGCHKVYPTPEAGAADFLRVLIANRPSVRSVIGSGNARAIAGAMKASRYFEAPVELYAQGLAFNAGEIARNMGEPLAVTIDGIGAAREEPPRPKACPPKPGDSSQ